nr:xylulose kinase-1 [Tanacetum cinerariifolium]
MGRILKIVGLRWVPTEKIFTSSTTTVDNKALHGSNTYITDIHECIHNLDSSAGMYINVQEEQTLNLNADEHIAVQRESKARTTLLQSIPDDHVDDFHYMDDAKDIWNAVKARFGGNAESKR